MKKGSNDNKWREILNEFSSYKGTMLGFCRENNLSKDTFYYYKKKFEKVDNSMFHAVPIKKDAATAEKISIDTASKDIRIEIGKAVLIVPSCQASLLADIIKELVKTC